MPLWIRYKDLRLIKVLKKRSFESIWLSQSILLAARHLQRVTCCTSLAKRHLLMSNLSRDTKHFQSYTISCCFKQALLPSNLAPCSKSSNVKPYKVFLGRLLLLGLCGFHLNTIQVILSGLPIVWPLYPHIYRFICIIKGFPSLARFPRFLSKPRIIFSWCFSLLNFLQRLCCFCLPIFQQFRRD